MNKQYPLVDTFGNFVRYGEPQPPVRGVVSAYARGWTPLPSRPFDPPPPPTAEEAWESVAEATDPEETARLRAFLMRRASPARAEAILARRFARLTAPAVAMGLI